VVLYIGKSNVWLVHLTPGKYGATSVLRVPALTASRIGSQAAERVAAAVSFFKSFSKFYWELGDRAHSWVRSDKGLKVSFVNFLDMLQMHMASVRLTSLNLSRCWEIHGPRACDNLLERGVDVPSNSSSGPAHLHGCRDCKARWRSLLRNASSKTKQRKSL